MIYTFFKGKGTYFGEIEAERGEKNILILPYFSDINDNFVKYETFCYICALFITKILEYGKEKRKAAFGVIT